MTKSFPESKLRIALAIVLLLTIVGPAGYVDYQNSSAFLLSRVILGFNMIDLMILIGSKFALIYAIFLIYKNKSKH